MAIRTGRYGINYTQASGALTDVDVNPADSNMQIALGMDGALGYKGAAPTITTTGIASFAALARKIQIVDWGSGAGYILYADGVVKGINGKSNPSGTPLTMAASEVCVDFAMDPTGNGQGYVLTNRGRVRAIGGIAAPTIPDFGLTPYIGRAIWVNWAGGAPYRYVVLDGFGALHFSNPGGQKGATFYSSYWGPGSKAGGTNGWDIARDVIVSDVAGYWEGYVLDGYGGLSPFWTSGEGKPPSISTAGAYVTSDIFRVVRETFDFSRVLVATSDARYWDYDRGSPVYEITSVTAPTGVQTTRRPTVTWKPALVAGTASPPDTVFFRVFVDTVYNAGQFDPNDALNAQYDSGPLSKTQTLGANASMQLPVDIPNGTWKVYVAVAKRNTDGTYESSDWVASPEWSIAGTLPVPTNVTPAAGALVNTDLPGLGMTLTADPLGSSVAGQWQIAQDAAFTAGLKEISDQLGDFKKSGLTTEPIPLPLALSQGTWFIRGREVNLLLDSSEWTTPQSFVVSHPPTTNGHSPSGGQAIPYEAGGNVSFHWTFSDSSPVDYQTAYQIEVLENDTNNFVATSGIVDSTVGVGTVVIPPTAANIELKWRVRVFDSDNVFGDFSDWNVFKVVESANLTITSPSGGVDNPQPTITWTYSASGRVQVAFRVVITRANDGVVVFDSTQLAGSSSSYQLPDPILDNNTLYTLSVTVYDNGGLASTQIEQFTTAWIPPTPGGSVTFDSSHYEEEGYLIINWDDAATDGDFRAWRIYRGNAVQVYSGTSVLVDEIDNGPFNDYSAPANDEVFYAVVQVASRFGVDVESDKVFYNVTLSGTHYWLVSNELPSLSLRLAHVVSDSFTNELERESYVIKGRGRKVDQGVRLGKNGTLTCEFNDILDGPTARQQRQKLELLQEQATDIYLRNPFGDVWKVSPTNIQVERVAGVGVKEYAKVTIPYEEVV
jgi:hypothetical protein